MDAYTRKRSIGGPSFSSRGGTLAFKNTKSEEKPYCKRLGCGSSSNSTKSPQKGMPEKTKSAASSFRSTCSKAFAGSSSRSLSSSSIIKKVIRDQEERGRQTLSIGERSSSQEEINDLEPAQEVGEADEMESVLTSSSNQTMSPDLEDVTVKLTHSVARSSSRTWKQRNHQLGSNHQETSPSSSLRHAITSRSTSLAVRPVTQSLRNLSCKSISGILPSNCSQPDNVGSKRLDTVTKRLYESGTSSSRAKNATASCRSETSSSRRSTPSVPTPSGRESPLPPLPPRRDRSGPVRSEAAVSVRTRRPDSGNTRTRLTDQEDVRMFLLDEQESVLTPQLLMTEASSLEEASGSEFLSFPFEISPLHEAVGRPAPSSRAARNRSASQVEDSSTRVLRRLMGDRDGYRRVNMEGVAEILLALDRIEQDEELSYEQLLTLETNLILGGMSFYDRHRDMRMDIDNMTYEELLALEEKMGTVSTALSEEALTKCLKKCIYAPPSSMPGTVGQEEADVKCSICQEEYRVGDFVGRLACEHLFHVGCIQQWLHIKNWCPVCKASACPS